MNIKLTVTLTTPITKLFYFLTLYWEEALCLGGKIDFYNFEDISILGLFESNKVICTKCLYVFSKCCMNCTKRFCSKLVKVDYTCIQFKKMFTWKYYLYTILQLKQSLKHSMCIRLMHISWYFMVCIL